MALELARSAERALGDLYTQPDALARLQELHVATLAGVKRSVETSRPEEFAHTVLDVAAQKVVEDLSWRLLTEPDMTPEAAGVPALLDLCIDGVVRKLLINHAPYKVLEDLMEGQTLRTCERLWDLLESRKEKLASSHFITKGGRTKASLCLLRMCNSLLRRLSKTHNSVFCGKILVFLSFTFSLSERSAVNLTGKANVTNVTVYEDEEEFSAGESADIGKGASTAPGIEIDKSAKTEAGPIDYNLYRTFWGIQRFFREHNLATHSADDWEKLFAELNVVLAAFEGNAFSPDDLERSRDLMSATGGAGSNTTEAGEHFFQPKYLTNSRLFRLQLRDPILRECVLTQFLILFNDLSRAVAPQGSSTPKSKIPELEKRVMALLKQTPSDGEGFSEMVSSVLERERNWIKWKMAKCPPYEKFPSKEEGDGAAATQAASKRKALATPLLEQVLTESSQPAHILDRIKGDSRATQVPLASYMERFTEAWDPENGIEEEYWPDTDEMHCWRTMRAAMRSSVKHLDLSISGAGALVKGILGITVDSAKKAAPSAVAVEDDAELTVAMDTDAPVKEEKEGEEALGKRERRNSHRSSGHEGEPAAKRERTREG